MSAKPARPRSLLLPAGTVVATTLLVSSLALYQCAHSGTTTAPGSAAELGAEPTDAAARSALAITGTPTTATTAGVAYGFSPATSGGAGALTFSIANKPGWAAFDARTGTLSGTPGPRDLGSSSAITLSVTDGQSTTALAPFMITVASPLDPSFVPAVNPCSGPLQGTHATYDAGPGKTYPDLSTVPWLSLQAGDVVNIYYRPEPYRTNIALKAQGTAAQPVIINGVTDAKCNRPIISGKKATNAADQANGYHDGYSKGLGVVLIHWGSGNFGTKPKFITIQNVAIVDGGADVCGIYAVTVEDLLVQNCDIHDNRGVGVFVNTKNEDPAETSYRVTIRGNRLYGNGTAGSYLYHNLYIQSYRALYEGNYIGQLVAKAEGSSITDRSSGTIIRYNHIVAAARAIDLVETEEGFTTVGKDPLYNDAWVYGNVIINEETTPGVTASGSLVHWGCDNTREHRRTGTLYFYGNTVLSNSKLWWISLFDQEGFDVFAENTVEMQNNIVWERGEAMLALARQAGRVNLVGTNWISNGWHPGDPDAKKKRVVVKKQGTVLGGTDPLVDPTTYRPKPGSPVIGAATGTTPTPLRYEFLSPLGVKARATARDLGAFEH